MHAIAQVTSGGKVNRLVVRILHDYYNIDATDARSKSWVEFKDVVFDFVITVCDNVKESCPVWPGPPIIAHRGSADPAQFEGTEDEKYNLTWKVAMQTSVASIFSVHCPWKNGTLEIDKHSEGNWRKRLVVSAFSPPPRT